MNVVVFGASGGTGRMIVLQALAHGHSVTAVVRDRSAFALKYPNLQVVQGDALKPETYRAALQDQDVIVSALGVSGLANSLTPMTFYADTARIILASMHSAGIDRYIGMSSVGVLAKPDTAIWYRLILKPLLRHKYADMRRMEAILQADSSLWTVVRPVRLVSGTLTEQFRVSLTGDLPRGGSISREDVAVYVVQCIPDDQTFRKAVAISY